ncbi:translation initiation factor IF-3, mitochondrial [Tachysurus fulvidraco]|uniref:translation initiation factor IF-3, mitochondrial n=1 Tax=Tachysurus fulvidraco TaxID=1234273 RepID=UPI001FEDBB5A|nr:translation initiation factor IF-3, mitochondrial [Tachysurus fulvidraco]
MPLGCLRLALSHTVRALCSSTVLYKPQYSRATWAHLGTKTQQWTLFSTVAGDDGDATEDEPEEKKKKKKKQDPKARTTIRSVGRKIHDRHLVLLDEEGENLGTVHRADALRLMDEKGLKLVTVNENAEPPVYRLMSGKQIHEEQMRLREKQKAKATGVVQVKDLTLSSDIALHDLDTKLKQVTSWLEKKHHVRLTLKPRRDQSDQALDSILDEMVGRITAPLGFVNRPKLIREGRAASCVLRPPSAKELQAQRTQPAAQTSSDSSRPNAEKPEAPSEQDKDSRQQ